MRIGDYFAPQNSTLTVTPSLAREITRCDFFLGFRCTNAGRTPEQALQTNSECVHACKSPRIRVPCTMTRCWRRLSCSLTPKQEARRNYDQLCTTRPGGDSVPETKTKCAFLVASMALRRHKDDIAFGCSSDGAYRLPSWGQSSTRHDANRRNQSVSHYWMGWLHDAPWTWPTRRSRPHTIYNTIKSGLLAKHLQPKQTNQTQPNQKIDNTSAPSFSNSLHWRRAIPRTAQRDRHHAVDCCPSGQIDGTQWRPCPVRHPSDADATHEIEFKRRCPARFVVGASVAADWSQCAWSNNHTKQIRVRWFQMHIQFSAIHSFHYLRDTNT